MFSFGKILLFPWRKKPLPPPNENVVRGKWGEDVAVDYLQQKGLEILARNVRPCVADKRCEIDIIAKITKSNQIVFVEVKSHRRRTPYSYRLSGITARKKRALLRACQSWILHNQWHGNFRFDVIEIWGNHTIDHIENVPLFGPKWRFW